MSPKEFTDSIRKILKTYSDDCEVSHLELDELMEKVLIELGYEEGIKLIKKSHRWYA